MGWCLENSNKRGARMSLYPARIDAHSYHGEQNPTMLNRDLQGVV